MYLFKVVLDFDEKFINDLLISKGVNPNHFNSGYNPNANANAHFSQPQYNPNSNVYGNFPSYNPYHNPSMFMNNGNGNGNGNGNQNNNNDNTNSNGNNNDSLLYNKFKELENNLSNSFIDFSTNFNKSNLFDEDRLVSIIDKAIDSKLGNNIVTTDLLEKSLKEFKDSIEIPSVSEVNLDILKRDIIIELKNELNINSLDIDIDSIKNQILSELPKNEETLLDLKKDLGDFKSDLEEDFKKKVSLLELENQKKMQELMMNYQFQFNQLQMNLMNPSLNQNSMLLSPSQVIKTSENVENEVEKTEEKEDRAGPSKAVGRKISSMMNI